ncbi:DUF2142 domain-containing protein [Methanobrevibacter sp.]|uniref:DUF2142 domain-containing protein n=1 Tax=Methanobrevibacter sp. TaxID=66852 RepID=UPI00388EE13C
MDIKNYFTDYRKCMLVFIAFIFVFVFAMFTPENFADSQNEVMFILLVTVVGLFSIYFSYRNKLKLHNVALVLIIVFGLLMIFFTPPMSFPDESAHFTRAELISEGQLYPEITDKGIYVDSYYFGLQQSYYGTTILDNGSYNDPINDHKGYWEWTTSSPFYSYLLSALGILIAKMLNLTAIWALYLSRIANLLFYGVVAYFMIKIIPKYKLHLLVFSTIPLCVSQASFSSYDAFILTFTLIILTYFIKMYLGEVNGKNLAIFFISVLLISLIKQPYIILAFLVFALPFEDEKLKKISIVAIIAMVVLAILSVGSLFSSLFTTTAIQTYNTSSTTNVSFVGQTRFVLSNPLIIFTLIKDMLVSIPDLFLLKANFFHYTGYKGIKLINFMYVIFYLVFSLFYKIDIELRKKERIILALIFLITYVGINVIFYLTWSPLGSNTILGVQSRYFLPIIALLPLIINTNIKEIEIDEIYIFTFIIICLAGLFLLPITHFY